MIFLMLSGCNGMRSQTKPDPEVSFICNASAYISLPDYEIEPLTSKSDKEFHLAAGKVMQKYPVLKDAYAGLYSCVKRYHPEIE